MNWLILVVAGLFEVGFAACLAKAKATYQEFINKYPNSELAEDAKITIENLGIPAEEILKNVQGNGVIDSSIVN